MGYSLPLRTRAVALASAGALAAAGAFTGLTATPAHAQQALEYEYFVAPTGDDDGPGTADRPLGSLEEAQQRARQAAAAGDGDVAVNLMDGVFRLDSPLRFEAADSGRNGHTVIWRAAPGAEPVVTGARPVTGWVLDDADAGVYRAEVDAGFDTRQLYVDGVLAQRARLGLSPSDLSLDAEGFTLSNPDLGWLSSLPDQRRVEFLAHLTWTTRITPVDHISGSRVALRQPAWDNNTYGYDTVQNPYVGPRFFLVGAKEFLDEPGEWYLDASAGTLYYKPLEGRDPADSDIEMPRLESLIEIGGTYDQPVTDLRFQGLSFTGTSWLHPNSSDGYANQQTGTFLTGAEHEHRPADAFDSCSRGCYEFEATRNSWSQTPAAVQVSAAERIVFENNTFVNLGSVALGIGNDANAHATGVGLGAHDVSVVGNTFTESAGGGIAVGGVRPDAHHPSDPRMVNSDILISDNRIYSTALEYLDNDAVLATYVTRLTIAHNYIADMPYSGIGIGYGWGANDAGGSQEYIDRGLYDFQPIYDTPTTHTDVHVVGNLLVDTVNTLWDAGCIYSLSAHPGSTIKGNVCDGTGQLGLYFDEGSRYFEATGNVMMNTAAQWAHANIVGGHNTGDLTLTGNYSTSPDITGLPDGERGNTVRENVVFPAGDLPSEAAEIVANAGPRGDAAPASGELRSVGSDRCLDVPGAATEPGTRLQIWACHGGENQRWTHTPSGELSVYSGGTRRCLDAEDNGVSDGTAAILWECHGGANQRWELNPDGTVTGLQSGLCLDVEGAATADGTAVILWTCNGGANQRWKLG